MYYIIIYSDVVYQYNNCTLSVLLKLNKLKIQKLLACAHTHTQWTQNYRHFSDFIKKILENKAVTQ